MYKITGDASRHEIELCSVIFSKMLISPFLHLGFYFLTSFSIYSFCLSHYTPRSHPSPIYVHSCSALDTFPPPQIKKLTYKRGKEERENILMEAAV